MSQPLTILMDRSTWVKELSPARDGRDRPKLRNGGGYRSRFLLFLAKKKQFFRVIRHLIDHRRQPTVAEAGWLAEIRFTIHRYACVAAPRQSGPVPTDRVGRTATAAHVLFGEILVWKTKVKQGSMSCPC